MKIVRPQESTATFQKIRRPARHEKLFYFPKSIPETWVIEPSGISIGETQVASPRGRWLHRLVSNDHSIILRIAIIARTSAAVGVIAKLIMFDTFHLPANWRNR
jgi:hypothetical protein